MIGPIVKSSFGNKFIRMDQISANTPTKTPVNSTNTETLVNSTNTETLFNSTYQDPFKDPVLHQSHA